MSKSKRRGRLQCYKERSRHVLSSVWRYEREKERERECRSIARGYLQHCINDLTRRLLIYHARKRSWYAAGDITIRVWKIIFFSSFRIIFSPSLVSRFLFRNFNWPGFSYLGQYIFNNIYFLFFVYIYFCLEY